MDFSELLSIAEKNKGATKEKNSHRSEFSAPKKEKRDKPRSEVVQKLIDEKNREKELEMQMKFKEKEKIRLKEEKRKKEKDERRKEEEKKQKFVIPKGKKETQAKIADVLKDLDSSDDDNEDSASDTDKNVVIHKEKSSHTHNGHKTHHSSSSHSSHSSGDRHKSESSSSDKHKSESRSSDRHKGESSNSDRHKGESSNSDRHKSESSSSDKHKGESSSSRHRSDREHKHKTDTSGHGSREAGHSSQESHHRTHSKDREKPKSDSSRVKDEKSDHHRSEHSERTDRHKSDKYSSSSSKSHSTPSSSSSSKHRTDSEKSSSSDKHKASSHSNSERKSSSSFKIPSKKTSSSDKEPSKKSSSSDKEPSKKSHSSEKEPSKKSAKNLSLEELREQVRAMKAMEADIAKEEEKEKDGLASNAQANMFEPHKNRHGVEMDEAEAKKAQILARTQEILERTKAKFAAQKETQNTARHRNKRSNTGDRGGGSDKQVKSKSMVKDDDSDDDSDEGGTHTLDMSFNGSLAQPESGADILKDIRKKINAKLSDYNFPDRPVKEKVRKPKSVTVRDRSVKLSKDRDRSDRSSKETSDRRDRRDKHDKKKLMSKQDKMKALMRNDYESSFGNGPAQPKVKRPVIIRRQQQQPPPMNFEELLKIAEKKCKEKEPEPVFKPKPKKKLEERPLTQDELDRRQREKDSRIRKKEEEELENSGKLGDRDRNDARKPTSDSPSNQKSKSESSLLKGALTKPKGQKNGNGKYDSENENVIVCGPSSSKPSRPAPATESTNPWDRIYGQIQKNNPKAEKRKRQVIESDEEDEESDYDMDDDFIDDGGAEEDVSAHIRNIFGYDKRKYRHIDEEDDRNMEASFTTVMKEEARSAKLGKMEDLEDIRREEEELRMKKLAKKKMKHR